MSKTAAKAIAMGICLLLAGASFIYGCVAGFALTFVVGRWCAKLMGWY